MEKTEMEKLNPYIVVGAVFRLRIVDWGKVEQFIKTLDEAELIFVQKRPKHVKLYITEKEGREDGGNNWIRTR